jgi:hypothetical protein
VIATDVSARTIELLGPAYAALAALDAGVAAVRASLRPAA